MIIKVSNLPVGIHAFCFKNDAEELQLGEPFVDSLVLDCKLDKSQHQIVANCNLTISVELNCDRCNDNYRQNLQTDFTLLFVYDRDKLNEDDMNIKYLSPADDKIDLTSDVSDYAKLALPLKKLCSEECKGLCVNCGTNLNLNNCNCKDDISDPVWDPLLKLKDKLN